MLKVTINFFSYK